MEDVGCVEGLKAAEGLRYKLEPRSEAEYRLAYLVDKVLAVVVCELLGPDHSVTTWSA